MDDLVEAVPSCGENTEGAEPRVIRVGPMGGEKH